MSLTIDQRAQLKRAADILKIRGIKELELYKFGIYRQYEVAGQKIRSYLLDDGHDDLTEDDYEMLSDCLDFTNVKGFTDDLGFPDEGQNTLILNDEGKLSYKTFTI